VTDGLTGSVSRPLSRPAGRTIRWVPLGGIMAVGVWVIRSGARGGSDPATIALPIATTMLGVWLCFLFEDEAAEITGPSPVPLWRRRAVLAAIATPVVAGVWFGFTWVGPLHGPTPSMAVMAVAIDVVALASAAVATRLVSKARSGPAAAAGLIGAVLMVPILLGVVFERPIAIDPSQVPIGNPATYWMSVIGVATAVLVVAHRDPSLPSVRVSVRDATRGRMGPIPEQAHR
jgi:hypothetical protein